MLPPGPLRALLSGRGRGSRVCRRPAQRPLTPWHGLTLSAQGVGGSQRLLRGLQKRSGGSPATERSRSRRHPAWSLLRRASACRIPKSAALAPDSAEPRSIGVEAGFPRALRAGEQGCRGCGHQSLTQGRQRAIAARPCRREARTVDRARSAPQLVTGAGRCGWRFSLAGLRRGVGLDMGSGWAPGPLRPRPGGLGLIPPRPTTTGHTRAAAAGAWTPARGRGRKPRGAPGRPDCLDVGSRGHPQRRAVEKRERP